MALKQWFGLDNSAKLYPFITTKDSQNLFRYTVELANDINPEKMQQAIDATLERFPSFAVRLRRGAFWYYLEHNAKRLNLRPESDIVMEHITTKNCDGFCMRIMYFKNRLTLEFFHIICDGSGAIQFIKSLIYTYLTILGHQIDDEGKVKTIDSPIDPREYEDSFIKNYKPVKLKNINVSSMTGGKKTAFTPQGERFNYLGKGVITADLNAKEVHAYCKSKGYTITHFLGGLYMYSVYMTKGKQIKNPKDIVLFIPMNLRKLYDSQTLRNFTLFTRAYLQTKKDDIVLDDCIYIVKEAIERCYNKEYLDKNISTTVIGEKILPVRLVPLFIKHLIFAISNEKSLKNPTKTATFSSIGVVDLPQSFKPFVIKMSFLLHACPAVPVSFTAITTFDTLTIGFTRLLKDTQIEEFFIKHLAELGFSVNVESNFWEVEDALQ